MYGLRALHSPSERVKPGHAGGAGVKDCTTTITFGSFVSLHSPQIVVHFGSGIVMLPRDPDIDPYVIGGGVVACIVVGTGVVGGGAVVRT